MILVDTSAWIDFFRDKRQGITVKTFDLLIACFANAHGLPLLSADQDFKIMQSAGVDILLLN